MRMRFYDRTEELQDLREVMRQSFDDHSRLTVLTGRRRIGKTSLGLKALEGTPMIYLFVSRKNESVLATEYAELIAKHYHRFHKGIFIGVGGSFDVLSGSKKRAPAIFCKLNLEWLYRIACEPSRLKRFYNSNVKFIFKIKAMQKDSHK